MKVDVLMTAYNHSLYVIEAMNSILNQSNSNIHLIIADDGSTDDTLHKIKANSDTRVKILEQQNMGVIATANSLLDLSDADFIFITSADDVYELNKFASQIDFMQTEDLDVSCTQVMTIDENGQIINNYDREVSYNKDCDLNAMETWKPMFFPVCSPSVAFKRKVGDCLRFNENYPLIHDWLFWFDCVRAGYRFKKHQQKTMKYRRHAKSLSWSKSAEEKNEFNRLFNTDVRDYFKIKGMGELRNAWENELNECA